MTPTKKHPKKKVDSHEIPPIPEGKIAAIIWLLAYKTGKAVIILLTIGVIIGIITTVSVDISRDKKGNIEVKDITVKPIEVEKWKRKGSLNVRSTVPKKRGK